MLAPDAPAPLQMLCPNAMPFHAPCSRLPPGLEHLFGAGIKKGAGYQHSRACIQPRACQPPTGNLCSYLAAHIAPRRTPCPLFQPWLLRHSQPPRPTLFDHDRDFSVARLNTHPPDFLQESANHLLGHGSILAHVFLCVNARNIPMNTRSMLNRKESHHRHRRPHPPHTFTPYPPIYQADLSRPPARQPSRPPHPPTARATPPPWLILPTTSFPLAVLGFGGNSLGEIPSYVKFNTYRL